MKAEAGLQFGELLRQRRRAAGLTQEELAARAGLSARGIADLERGARRTPRRDTVALLIRALGGSPDDEAAFFAATRPAQSAGAPNPPAYVELDADSERAEAAPPAQAPHNLPAQLTHLLGRDEAVRAVVALLRRADLRLLMLTGPGGIGKTRLAIQVAAELLNDFADGVWFVRLSRLTDHALVVPTIAETLGLKEAGGQSIAEVLRIHLRQRRMALVLDNCEHVAAAAPDVAELLEASPALTVLATSRMPLRLRGEHVYSVSPLALPPAATVPDIARAPERLVDYPAAALFVERARAARPDFALTAANAPAVAEICARLDGLPLAIELAAVRVKLLPPSALLARMGQGLGFLTGGARDLAERQQALHSTIAWSEGLLSADERVLFRRLAVFAGGCTLQAAETVCAAPRGTTPLRIDVLDGLTALVDQNLVQQRDEDGEPRFGMLHVIREYALDRLEASGEAEPLRRAHAAFMVALAERAEPELTGPQSGTWLGRLDREHDNLRAVLGWALGRGEREIGLRLVASLYRFWMGRGHLREGRTWAEELLALEARVADDDTPAQPGAVADGVHARALLAAGVLALYQGDNATAGVWFDRAVMLANATGDRRTAAHALSGLGVMAQNQTDLTQAGVYLEQSLTLMREVGEPRGIAVALVNLGLVVYGQDDDTQAEAYFSEALALARQLGDRDLIGTCLANLSAVAIRHGDVAHADALGREAMALYRDVADPRRCAVGLEGLAATAALLGRGVRAARLLGAAAVLREVLGAPQPPIERSDTEQAVAAARVALGEERWAAAFAAGQSLSLEAAISEALAEVDEPDDCGR
jgi:predicted ATPase/transcriptional regulator with XRE-family HTH domain